MQTTKSAIERAKELINAEADRQDEWASEAARDGFYDSAFKHDVAAQTLRRAVGFINQAELSTED